MEEKRLQVKEPLFSTGSGAEFPSLKRVPTKMHSYQLAFVSSLPICLTIVVAIALIHDLIHPAHNIVACSRLGPAWGSSLVEWLSRDWPKDSSTVKCNCVISSKAIWAHMIILPSVWGIIIYYSRKCWQLSSKKGDAFCLTKSMLESMPHDSPIHIHLAASFCKDVERMRAWHVLYVAIFQGIMFFVDWSFYKKTVRWVFAYQIMWLGFAACIVQVRPTIEYCVLLSQVLIDNYILEMFNRHNPTHVRRSWLDLAARHRELELKISNLWHCTELASIIPSLPFGTFSMLHFLSDPSEFNAAVMSTFLLTVAGVVLGTVLNPIARIATMFTGAAAFRSEWKPGAKFKRGSLSVVAVARSLIKEEPARTSDEDREYQIYLEFVQGHSVAVHIGSGPFRVGITKSYVSKLYVNFVVKIPLVVSAFLALRTRWEDDY